MALIQESMQNPPDRTETPVTNVQRKAGVECGEFTNRANREQCASRRSAHATALLAFMSLMITGCAGMWSRAMTPEPPDCGIFFGGVIVDATEFMMDTSEPWVVAGGIIDLPFNLVTDIVLAPYDLYQLQRANYVYCSRAREGIQPVTPTKHPAGS